MECLAQSSSLTFMVVKWAIFLVVCYFVLANVDFQRFKRSSFLNMFCAAVIVLLLFWRIRFQTDLDLAFHFLGMSAVVLIFHWLYAVVIGILVCSIGPLIGVGSFSTIPTTVLFVVLVPVAVTLVFLKWERSINRRLVATQPGMKNGGNFFVFIMLPGFLGAAFAIGASVLGSVLMCWTLNDAAWSSDHDLMLQYLPLIMLPEGIINGMLVTAFVAFWPERMHAFHEEDYF